ncbi:DUF2029 domain-containing protein [Candidatus Poribacteria bacterium]|nr:DUF2029 domain-containing protein [Candidatus Poribacteria bacterium]
MRWGLIGLSFISLHLLFVFTSLHFAYERNLAEKPTLLLASIELLAGALYLAAIHTIRNKPRDKASLLFIISVGLIVRAALLNSTPALEDDYYRYLWDGAVTANGINPYAYAPDQAMEDTPSSKVPHVLRNLAVESGTVIQRVNHPNLRTIYPPVAQIAFASAYWLQPWSIVAWRLTLFLFDSATLVILIMILRTLGLPLCWVSVYYLNPVLLKEIFNSGHMDVVVLPFVLGAVFLAARRKYEWAAISLAAAMGVKVWPVVFLPIVLRPILGDLRRLLLSLFFFALAGCAMFLPIYIAGLNTESGFIAYGQQWEMNDALFMLFAWMSAFILKVMGITALDGKLVARIVVALMLATWVAWLARKKIGESVELFERCLLVVAAIFLLSPVQFPWYYTWMVPFLAIRPRTSLLLLTALLPLYYLRFHFVARDEASVFDYGIVWLEYIPVWFLLVVEWYRESRGSRISPAIGAFLLL